MVRRLTTDHGPLTKMDLTPSQQAAVEHFEGPLLVLAGPGSGKTRVITRRIARLVERGVEPRHILAITFTNKAANEMAERVARLLPGTRVWVSTFHRFCARMLRERGEAIGLQPNFSILDTADQQQLIRDVLGDLDLDATHFSPAKILARISSAKNEMLTPEQFAQGHDETIGDHLQAVVAKVYPEYQRLLLQSNSVDFDDLLLHVATLLAENPELRSQWDRRFRFILVDEYQDTNLAQYQIVLSLSQDFRNLCVTGDPDQSIYGWRGAQIENILRFEHDYPDAKVVRLEENFRSTKSILRAADSLISHNIHRKAKSLITDNPEGEEVELRCYDDGRHEADRIAAEIRQRVEAGERQYSDFAIFYRVNALSRSLEIALARQRVPFQVAGGVAFYERAEIKDMVAYLRLIENPADRVAFQRIINTPVRGIGKTTVSRLTSWADRNRIPLLEAARAAKEIPKLPKRAVTALQQFAGMIAELAEASAGPVENLLNRIIHRTGYTREWQGGTEQEMQRLANVEELVSAARQYDQTAEEPSLAGFLETASLAQDVDNVNTAAGRVTLMTLHAAKGLEFPVVYIVAVEQNLIPHERSLRDNAIREIEEERRLLFVGMTRAMRQLSLTQTRQREFRGRNLATIPSPFLQEIPLQLRDLSSYGSGESEGSQVPPDEWDHDAHEPHAEDIPAEPPPTSKPLLMSGADLLNSTAGLKDVPQGFRIGMMVRHPRYGLGTVIDLGGYAKRRTVTVRFDTDDRQETFIAAKCPLQPVGVT